jgi:TolB-like protein/tetratricopeptide (TPR) repeat protein
MGVVFLAQDTILHRPVALKVLLSSGDDDSGHMALLREARNASALNHPGICTIYEVGTADGWAFIAMEYVDGQPLSDVLAESPLPLNDVLRHGIEAAEALTYAHEHGVVHRDFKAANAIVSRSRHLKVVDFGLARRGDIALAGATTMATAVPAGAAAGTPYAMAPEQIRGEPADARTDIWALGVLLHEMVSGTKPFTGPTTPDLFSSILRDAPKASSAPPELQSVIERCLQKRPEDRYDHTRDVVTALESIHAGPMPARATGRGVWRRPWLAVTATLFATIVLLVAGNIGGVRGWLTGRIATAAPIRLAVLPFENLTGDPEQEYLSDGLTEEMITQLGRLHPQRLSVIARTSSMRYKNRDVPVDQIGRELGVDYVMEGSARREGNRIRVSATLVQVRDQSQRWTDSFDRELASVLALQGDVARGVAQSLALTLLPDEQARLANQRRVNPNAYEAYLKGQFHAQKETQADLDLALKYFENALQADPDYAAAHTGIAFVWTARNQMGFVPPSVAIPLVKAAAMKAVTLDPESVTGHYALAMAAWNEWDWETNEREFRRTIELDPSHAVARAWYSHLLIALKRPDEAVSQAERAMQLDPLNVLNQALYGTVLYVVRRYDEAIRQFENALKTSPNHPVAQCGLWRAFHLKGRLDEALVAAEACLASTVDGSEVKNALQRGRSEAGYNGAMRRVADWLAAGATGTYVPAMDVFAVYLNAGEKDLALQWLAKAVDARDPNIYGAIRNPFANDSLGGDQRFRELVRRSGLPE